MIDNTEHREPRSYLISAREVAEFVSGALLAGKKDSAVRWLTEAVARLIASQGQDLPVGLLAEPETTGDHEFDVVLATAFLYAVNLCGIDAPAWMYVERLEEEFLWGGDGHESEAYKDFIRRETPAVFLERNVRCRPRDWVNA